MTEFNHTFPRNLRTGNSSTFGKERCSLFLIFCYISASSYWAWPISTSASTSVCSNLSLVFSSDFICCLFQNSILCDSGLPTTKPWMALHCCVVHHMVLTVGVLVIGKILFQTKYCRSCFSEHIAHHFMHSDWLQNEVLLEFRYKITWNNLYRNTTLPAFCAELITPHEQHS